MFYLWYNIGINEKQHIILNKQITMNSIYIKLFIIYILLVII